jgi:hypothetical protein
MIIVKLILVLVFTGIYTLLAAFDAGRIKSNKKIYHGINGLVTLLVTLPVYLIVNQWFFIIGLLALRRIVFDTALNIFRGLSFDYISSNTTSIIDRLSYRFQAKYGYVAYYGIFLLIVLFSILLNS